MQEHAVLDLAPLGIDGDAALGHGSEVIWVRAGTVDVPTLEDVARRSGGLVVVCTLCVVGRQVRAINNAADLAQLAAASIDGIVVAIDVDAIHEIDLVGVARVVKANG